MLDSNQKLVNPLILTLCLILSSCGFQLNRNQVNLPLGAKSVYVKAVQNQTYKEGAAIHLQSLIEKELAQEKVQLSSSNGSDLSLEVIVTDFQVSSVNQQNLVTVNYEFRFIITAEVSLLAGKKKTKGEDKAELLWKKEVKGKYLFETSQSVLTHKEEKLGYQKAIKNLAPEVARLVTVGF